MTKTKGSRGSQTAGLGNYRANMGCRQTVRPGVGESGGHARSGAFRGSFKRTGWHQSLTMTVVGASAVPGMASSCRSSPGAGSAAAHSEAVLRLWEKRPITALTCLPNLSQPSSHQLGEGTLRELPE